MASFIRSEWLAVSLRGCITIALLAAWTGWPAPVRAAGSDGDLLSPPPVALSCGVPATATIPPGGQQDSYTFAGEVGDQVYATLLKTGGDAGFTPGMVVYDPAGNPVLDTATVTGVEPLLTLGATGTYVVQAHDEAGTANTGTYQLGLEWLTPVAKRCAAGTTLGCGPTQARTLAAAGRHDLHTFVAAAGDRVWLMSRQTGGDGFVAALRVYDPNGTMILNGITGTEQLHALTANGTYTVEVHDWNGVSHTGTYELGLEWLAPAAKQCGGQVLTCGAPLTASWPGGMRHDPFSFAGEAGDRVYVTLLKTGGDAGYTPGLMVYDPTGNPVLDTATVTGVEPLLTLGATGTYVVQAHDEAGTTNTGTYQLGLEWLTPVAKRCAAGTTLGCGPTQARTLAAAGRHDLHTFAAAAGDRVWLMSRQTGGDGFVPALRVYDPNGTMILNGITGTEQLHALTANGTYTVEVHDWNGVSHTGTYELGLEWLAPAAKQCGGQVLTCGAPLTASWPGGMRHDPFSFAGEAGDRVYVTLLKTGGDAGYTPGLMVYDPTGNPVLDTATVTGVEPLLTLGATGTYVVQAHDEAGTANTGTYQLGLEWLTPVAKRCAAGTTLGCGPTQARTLAAAGRHDLHTFVAAAGDRVWLMSRQTGGDGFVSALRVYDPNGTMILNGITGTEQLHALTANGTYTVEVHDWNGVSHTGTYELGLEWLAPAAKQCGGQVLTCGAPLTASWPGGMRHDPFSFAGEAGDRVYVTLLKTGGDAGYTPGLMVYDPTGNPVLDTATVTGVEPLLTLGATGTYVVQAHDEAGTTNTGTYQLGLEWLTPVAKRCAAGTTLGCGPTQARTLAAAGRHDLHTFAAAAGDRVWLMSRQTGGDGFVPALRVYDPNGTMILNGVTGTEQLHALTANGTYTVEVHDWNGVSHTGTYELGLEWLAPAAKQCGGQVLTCGAPLTASWPGGMRHDPFSFAGEAGDRVYVTLLKTGGDAGYTPGLMVYDPTGNPVLDTATVTGVEPLLTLGATGTYVVQAHDEAGTTNTGTYQLGLEWLTPVAKRCAAGTTLGCGPTQARTLAAAGRHDLHTFVAAAGDRVWLMSRQTGGDGFVSALRVYDPNGTMILNGVTGTEQLHALTATGTYTVEVHDWNGVSHTGTYELGLEWLAPAAKQCGGQVLTCGAPLTASWPGGMRHDPFSFAGEAGDRLWLTLARTGGDANYAPGMTVYDPAGNPVLDTGTAAGIDPLLNLGVTGTYVVQVHDEGGTTNTGSYALAANWLLPSGKRCGVSPVGCDNTVAAAIGSAAQVRLHQFPAKAGDSLRLSFAKTGGASAFAPLVRVYDPSGGLVAELGSAGTLALDNLPAQGFYLANVHDASLLSAGTYSLQRAAVASGDCWAVPEFTSVDRARFQTAVPGLFPITAVGNPVPTLAQSGVLPAVVSFATGGAGSATLSGTAGVSGIYPLTLTATNSWETTPQAFTLAVNDPLAFADDPLLVKATRVRLLHLTDLRSAIDALRAFYLLPAAAWTDGAPEAGVTVIKAEHLDELRAAVSGVYVAAGRTPPAWSTGTISPRATVIAAAPIEEIRAAVKGIW